MNMNRKIINTAVLAVLVVSLLLPSLACQSAGSNGFIGTLTQTYNNVREWFIMNGANDRIEKIRKDDVSVTVVDDNGTPVRGARVTFEQQSHDFLFGSELSPLGEKEPNSVNPDWADAYTALFNYGTLPFYWDIYEPKQNTNYRYSLESMADWAKKRGITLKGQPLISAGSVPAWAPLPAADMQKQLEKRVKELTTVFCGRIDYWDVVNEPISGTQVNNPVGNWLKTETPEVACADAIAWAKSGCPKATTIINDYRTDQDYRNLLQNIIRQRSHFDAIGIQSHMHRGNWPFYQVWDICDRFQDFDVPIHFTEVTVVSGAFKTGIGDNATQSENWTTTAAGEAMQADYVEKFYTLLFSHPSVQAITWWNFSDLNAWQGAPAGLLRANMSKKPAYARLMKLIHDTWWSRGKAFTSDDGKAVFRGFYGSYKITVDKEGKASESTINIVRGVDNKLEVKLAGYKQLPPTPFYELVWPYAVAAVVIVIIILILMWVAKIRRRI
jgi:endo-1,4-beta-xylanase